mmetsp:Transcript_14905/g.30112  ORF Transcript_14905/g.30112 Transcript_14905/m.30112 type:complete len:171 (-) Transcript_14905:662-1174(-)
MPMTITAMPPTTDTRMMAQVGNSDASSGEDPEPVSTETVVVVVPGREGEEVWEGVLVGDVPGLLGGVDGLPGLEGEDAGGMADMPYSRVAAAWRRLTTLPPPPPVAQEKVRELMGSEKDRAPDVWVAELRSSWNVGGGPTVCAVCAPANPLWIVNGWWLNVQTALGHPLA